VTSVLSPSQPYRNVAALIHATQARLPEATKKNEKIEIDIVLIRGFQNPLCSCSDSVLDITEQNGTTHNLSTFLFTSRGQWSFTDAFQSDHHNCDKPIKLCPGLSLEREILMGHSLLSLDGQ
jgi:hypothetical protein